MPLLTFLFLFFFSSFDRHYGNTHGKSNILTSGDLTSFMYQVARGMEYLSSCGVSKLIRHTRMLSLSFIRAHHGMLNICPGSHFIELIKNNWVFAKISKTIFLIFGFSLTLFGCLIVFVTYFKQLREQFNNANLHVRILFLNYFVLNYFCLLFQFSLRTDNSS